MATQEIEYNDIFDYGDFIKALRPFTAFPAPEAFLNYELSYEQIESYQGSSIKPIKSIVPPLNKPITPMGTVKKGPSYIIKSKSWPLVYLIATQTDRIVLSVTPGINLRTYKIGADVHAISLNLVDIGLGSLKQKTLLLGDKLVKFEGTNHPLDRMQLMIVKMLERVKEFTPCGIVGCEGILTEQKQSASGALFMGCTRYPDCNYTSNINTKKILPKNDYDKACSQCGAKMVLRTNKGTGDMFWGCSFYPKCKNTEPMEKNGL